MNDKHIDLSVVVPVFNEEDSVPHLCGTLHKVVSKLNRSYEIILVDDGSRDKTWDKLVEASRAIPRLRLVRLSWGLRRALRRWSCPRLRTTAWVRC